MIVTLYRAGLRISEALALLPKDLDAQASTIRVLHGKGDHDRVVGLDAGAWAILQLWLDRRAAAGINGHARVFCTLKSRPVKSAYVRTLLPRLARKAGIDRRVHAHGLRHTHAFELAGEGYADPSDSGPTWSRLGSNHGSVHQALAPGRRGGSDEGEVLDAVAGPGRPQEPAGCGATVGLAQTCRPLGSDPRLASGPTPVVMRPIIDGPRYGAACGVRRPAAMIHRGWRVGMVESGAGGAQP